jgi:hypothetical protein
LETSSVGSSCTVSETNGENLLKKVRQSRAPGMRLVLHTINTQYRRPQRMEYGISPKT